LNPLRAVALGGRSSALVGERSLSTQINDPARFSLLTPPGSDSERVVAAFVATAEPLARDAVVADAQRAVASAAATTELLPAPGQGAAPGDAYASPPSATSLLETAATLIELDLGTQVIVVVMNGFDTHAGQTARHAELLADLAGGIAGFSSTVASRAPEQDVLVMTTSEFGRRVAENASGGTDHGNAGVQLLCGTRVRGGLIGASELGSLVEGDLPIVVPTGSMYAAALDWLGGPTDEVLGRHHDRLDLVEA
jgi:uncharacterized protein (DUF1501 family)